MPDLSRDLRQKLKTTIESAREASELGAAEALRRLGVFESRRPERLDDARNETRKRLRAHAKSLGDSLTGTDGEPLRRLVEAAAYVQWHRLLFARFLLERGLLRDDLGVVSLADCRDEAGAGGDEWAAAAAHTARMLPGVFPADDPVEALALAPEHAKALRDLLMKLDATIFQADDSLGWTYQFWRAAEKERINQSGSKIGAAELPAVTQLFTEPYMVRFLLHNTLGAWWAGKVLATRPDLARGAADENVLRSTCALPGYAWDFLRFVKEDEVWRPAAGVFSGWPVTPAELTVLDPCCGSGHFLTEALAALAALRGFEEGILPVDAVVAVLRDNLAGLEIDGRCVQIAAFALAMMAWRIGGPGAALPTPHIAWVGCPPPLPKPEFAALANGDTELRRGLEALHDLFVQAPLLGSLISPISAASGDLLDPLNIAQIDANLDILVSHMRAAEPSRAEGALAARGMADAAAILARKVVLQATNVPFLSASKMITPLSGHLKAFFGAAKGDLATAMLKRMCRLSVPGGSVAVVTPHNWYELDGHRRLRAELFDNGTFNIISDLGPGAFQDMNFWVSRTALTIYSVSSPERNSEFSAVKADLDKVPAAKNYQLRNSPTHIFPKSAATSLPSVKLLMDYQDHGSLLSEYSDFHLGICTGDYERFGRYFYECVMSDKWELQQSTTVETGDYEGCSNIVLWEGGRGSLLEFVTERLGEKNVGSWLRGENVWGERAIIVTPTGDIRASLYAGRAFDNNSIVLTPHKPDDLAALWEYISSLEYSRQVRLNSKALKVQGDLVQVPFDCDYYKGLALAKYPNGLPEPYSDDPTQWLFHGHPRHATTGTELHVALARLSGYRWPAETDTAMRLSAEARARIAEAATLPPSDDDGLLALVPVLGERPLADRLRAFCIAAWGDAWTANTEATLVAAACEKAKDKPPRTLTIDAWLRTHAARQHAKLFHDRPFLWWITDGRADGFTAVAHYHRLTKGNLERLTYTVLGDWITRLGDDPRAEAARVLQTKLATILEGEAPYDIFVRWKPLHAQPLGWDPDLDDGVRLNIRPFIQAGVLAHNPNVRYTTDRGKDVSSAPWFDKFNGERRNDHHTTLAEKRAARAVPAG